MQALDTMGFETCTDIQAKALPPALSGRDILGQAQTGTGKTATFLLSSFCRMIRHPIGDGSRYAGEPRILVLAPTRELAMQIATDAEDIGRNMDASLHLVVGGVNIETQIQQLHDGYCDLLVGTPGRVLDLLKRREIFLDQVEVLVLDEADRMLDMGFMPDVRAIVRKCPPQGERQTLLFSATLEGPVRRVATMFTKDPVSVSIEPDRPVTDKVQQIIYLSRESERLPFVMQQLRQEGSERVILFTNRRDSARKVHESLQQAGFRTGLLSGELQQGHRTKTLNRFKEGDLQVLVATDIAGRGIHVDDVSHVINFDLPLDADQYVHRIGRTGRAGTEGTAISFATENQAFMIPAIEKRLGGKLFCKPLPSLLPT